jgi:hypothetical protein
MLVNHPMMPFLGWDDSFGKPLRSLGVHLELGILPDLLHAEGRKSTSLIDAYPDELLVFGSDLGHAHHPTLAAALPGFLHSLQSRVGLERAAAIMTTNGRELIGASANRK